MSRLRTRLRPVALASEVVREVKSFLCQMPDCVCLVTISPDFVVTVRTGITSFVQYYRCSHCRRLYEKPTGVQTGGKPIFSHLLHFKAYGDQKLGLVLVPLNAGELLEYLSSLVEILKGLRDGGDRKFYLGRLQDVTRFGHSQDCTLSFDDPPVSCNCGVRQAEEVLAQSRPGLPPPP